MTDKKTLRRVLAYIRGSLGKILLTLLLALAIVGMTLYVPILIGDAIDLCVEGGGIDFAAILTLLLRAGVLIALTALLQWVMSVLNSNITYNVVHDIRRDAIRKIQALPLSYIDAHPAGETVNRVISDVDTFSDGLLMGFTQFFTGVITILGTLAFMIVLDWRIALLVVVLTPLSLFVAKFIAEHTHAMFLEQSRTKAEQSALIDEIVTNQKISIAFSHGGANLEKFDEVNDRLAKCSVRALFYSALVNPSTRVVTNLVYGGTALLGGLFCIGAGATMTVGSLAVFLRYANQYTKPFNEISGVVTELQNALSCAARLFELLDAPDESQDAPDAATLVPDGHVTLENVAFRYVPDRPLIEGFDLDVAPGQRIAIVGPTGCGKTTLINLLMRFYEIDGGRITLDGVDTSRMDRGELRQQFGMVLQDAWLFDGTIAENIAYGCPEATRDEIVAAARAAQVDFFVRTMPQGYDTHVANDAESISQGQRQLLTIARVLLNNPAILILDEATSSVDTRTELAIGRAMDALMHGRTSFVIAHRLSTIVDADLILVMDHGNIIEQGTHKELLAAEGAYADLYLSQFA